MNSPSFEDTFSYLGGCLQAKYEDSKKTWKSWSGDHFYFLTDSLSLTHSHWLTLTDWPFLTVFEDNQSITAAWVFVLWRPKRYENYSNIFKLFKIFWKKGLVPTKSTQMGTFTCGFWDHCEKMVKIFENFNFHQNLKCAIWAYKSILSTFFTFFRKFGTCKQFSTPLLLRESINLALKTRSKIAIFWFLTKKTKKRYILPKIRFFVTKSPDFQKRVALRDFGIWNPISYENYSNIFKPFQFFWKKVLVPTQNTQMGPFTCGLWDHWEKMVKIFENFIFYQNFKCAIWVQKSILSTFFAFFQKVWNF